MLAISRCGFERASQRDQRDYLQTNCIPPSGTKCALSTSFNGLIQLLHDFRKPHE